MSPKATAEAFNQIKPELDALSPDALIPLEFDPVAAVHTALAAVPRIREHRDAIAEQLPQHPIEHVDNIDVYALGAWYTQLAHTYASGDPEATKTMVEEATKLRDGLLIAAEALAHRDLLDADAVAKLRKGGADLASDLVALASLFSSSWGRVSSKTAVERHEVDRAAELGPAVLVAQSMTTKKGGKAVDTADQRARAFTALAGAYDSCRRALTYLRWKEGDADSIAPSLYKKRPGRKPKKEGEAEAESHEESSQSE